MTDFRHSRFALPKIAERVAGSYLTHDLFSDALTNLTDTELPGFLRTYIEEGTPFAFSENPLLWESIRDFLSSRLSVPARHVGSVGSAKVGFSLNPTKFGEPFSDSSDLDLVIVDGPLFYQCKLEGNRFCEDFRAGRVIPRTEKQKEYWEDSASATIGNQIKKGFLDANKVPAIDSKYPKCTKLNDEASIVCMKLGAGHLMKIKKVSFRVFNTWEDFSERQRLNFRSIGKKLREAKSGKP